MNFFRLSGNALVMFALASFLVSPSILRAQDTAQEVADSLPDPDGKDADMSQPVQVYILLGQSNMLGFGKIKPKKDKPEGSLTHAVNEEKKYPYLINDAGEWTERKDVRNVRVMGSGTDVARAKQALAELDKYYPGATKYEVAGFFFWQGDKDRYNAGHASRYEQNLVQLIKALRKDFDAPKAKFVCATLGQTKRDAKGNEGLILNAQLAVDGENGKYPEFKGNVATVYTHPLSKGGASNSHYGGNAETYMNVGEAMGQAMVELIETTGEE